MRAGGDLLGSQALSHQIEARERIGLRGGCAAAPQFSPHIGIRRVLLWKRVPPRGWDDRADTRWEIGWAPLASGGGASHLLLW